MTVQNPPIWLQTGSHTAEQVRRWAEATLGTNEGVMGGDELAVTHSSAMTLSIAEGRVLISGTENSYQGTYFCENRGAATVTVTGGDATNPRIDLVVARVRDSVYSGSAGNDGFTLEVVTGTAAASPSAPTLPDNCVALAEVAVAVGASSLTARPDRRAQVRKPGRYSPRASLAPPKIEPPGRRHVPRDVRGSSGGWHRLPAAGAHHHREHRARQAAKTATCGCRWSRCQAWRCNVYGRSSGTGTSRGCRVAKRR